MLRLSTADSDFEKKFRRLVDGRREAVQVRLGASDGSMTEVAGNLSEGDLIVTGERAAAR